jgi:S1-C subfamily serine protease
VNWLDIIIIAVVILGTLHGVKLGFSIQIFSYSGFLLGMFIGVLLVPVVINQVSSQTAKSLISLGIIFGVAMIVGGLGRALGSKLWKLLRRFNLGHIDAVLRGIFAALFTLLVCWLLANTVLGYRFSALNKAIENSAILRTVGTVLPPAPSWFSHLSALVDPQGFPSVFAKFATEAAGPVTLPTQTQLEEAVAADGNSTVKIIGKTCGEILEGSGFVVTPNLVVTNAHVIAGVRHPEVITSAGAYSAVPIYFNPRFDMAVLKTTVLPEPPLHLLNSYVPRGTKAAVLGYPGGGPFVAHRAGIMGELEAEGRDIYDQGLVTRAIYKVEAHIIPGNSGGPLVEPNGEVIGIVVSKSVSNSDVGYALTSPQVLHRLTNIINSKNDKAVSTSTCIS